MPHRICFGRSKDGVVLRGTLVKSVNEEGLRPILVVEDDVLPIGENEFALLEDKKELQVLALSPSEGGYTALYANDEVEVKVTDSDVIVKAIAPEFTRGMKVDRGLVVDVGDNLVAVRDVLGNIEVLQKSLIKPRENGREGLAKTLFAVELKKSRVYSKESASLTPKFSDERPIEGVNYLKEAQGQEGDTRMFGPHDRRRLARTDEGVLRWVNDDEAEAMGLKPLPPMKSPAQTVSDLIHNPPKLREKSQPEKWQRTPEPKERSPKLDDENFMSALRDSYADYSSGELKRIDAYIDKLDEGPEKYADVKNVIDDIMYERQYGETRQETAERREAFRNSEGYQNFLKEATADGLAETEDGEVQGGFRLKVLDHEFEYEITRSYDSTSNHWDTKVDGNTIRLHVDGRAMMLDGGNGERLKLRDPDSWQAKEFHRSEIDEYKGELMMDENGAIFVKMPQGEVPMETAKGVGQEELLKPQTIMRIGRLVFGSTKEGSPAVYNDTLLGRINQVGVLDYKDDGQIGVVRSNGEAVVVSRDNFNRDATEDRLSSVWDSEDTQPVVDRVRKDREKIDDNGVDVRNISFARSSRELRTTSPGEAAETIDNAKEYDTTLSDYLTPEAAQELSLAKYTPEYNAAISVLAQKLKAYDEGKNVEIEALNVNRTVKLRPRKVFGINSYMGLAREKVEEAVKEHRDRMIAERQRKLDAGQVVDKFDPDEHGDAPEKYNLLDPTVYHIYDALGYKYSVQYAWVPRNLVVGSHDVNGTKNVEAPPELQPRLRELDPSSMQQMSDIVTNPDERLVAKTSNLIDGPTLAYAKDGRYWVIGGHGRKAAIDALQGDQRSKYLHMMQDAAVEHNQDPSKLHDDDILIRVLTPEQTYGDAKTLAFRSNLTGTIPMNEIETARGIRSAVGHFGKSVSLEGIGLRPITAQNVHKFIHNNPRLYDAVLQNAGVPRATVEKNSTEQAKAVNVALLSQLSPRFLDGMARMGNESLDLIRSVAPILFQNSRSISENKVPAWANLQEILPSVMSAYDSMQPGQKKLFEKKFGQVPFLDPTRKTADAQALYNLIRQEVIKMEGASPAEARDLEKYRDPMMMIALTAYGMTARKIEKEPAKKTGKAGPESNNDFRIGAMTNFALRLRRFQEAMEQVARNDQQDLFFGGGTDEDFRRGKIQDMLGAAETTLLHNRRYVPSGQEAGEENLTAEEQEEVEKDKNEQLHDSVLRVFQQVRDDLKKEAENGIGAGQGSPTIHYRSDDWEDALNKSLWGKLRKAIGGRPEEERTYLHMNIGDRVISPALHFEGTLIERGDRIAVVETDNDQTLTVDINQLFPSPDLD